jgi:hypothetical protein
MVALMKEIQLKRKAEKLIKKLQGSIEASDGF